MPARKTRPGVFAHPDSPVRLRKIATDERKREERERSAREAEHRRAALKLPSDILTSTSVTPKSRVKDLLSQGRFARHGLGSKATAFGVAAAYSIARVLSAAPDRDELKRAIAGERGFKLTTRTDDALIAVRAVFEYGATEEEARANRQYAKDHADAVRYLLSADLDPAEALQWLSRKETSFSVLKDRWRRRAKSDHQATERPAPHQFTDALGAAGSVAAAAGTSTPEKRKPIVSNGAYPAGSFERHVLEAMAQHDESHDHVALIVKVSDCGFELLQASGFTPPSDEALRRCGLAVANAAARCRAGAPRYP
jgi:hypothetical protein